MLQEGENGSQMKFHINGSKRFSRESVSEGCLQRGGRRANKATIDHDDHDNHDG